MDELISIFTSVTGHDLPNAYRPAFVFCNPLKGTYGYGYAFVDFFVGGLCGKYEDRIRAISPVKRNVISVLGIIVSCFLLFLTGVFYTKQLGEEMWDVVWNGYNTLFTFLNVFFIYFLSLNYKREHKLIKNISLCTLGIYFTHGIFIMLTQNHLLKYDYFCNIPANLIYALLILLVCLGLTMIIRKIPIIKNLV